MSRNKLFVEVFIDTINKARKLTLNKRQKFVITVLLLSFGLFLSEHLLGKSGFFVAIILSVLADILFVIVMYKDIKGIFPQMLILPFLYTFAFSLFYFLFPGRFLTRIGWTVLYAIGLYSLYLSQNIFAVASIRTIALLSGARIVSFVIAFLSYGFLSKVVFSLDWPLVSSVTLKPLFLFVASFFLILQSIWTITLDTKSLFSHTLWSLVLSLCLLEVSVMLWFWPTTSTFIAIFLTGSFYAILGLSHAWFDRRLFRGVIWEYIWVAVSAFFILLLFTSWKG